METKVCTKCGEVFPLTTDYFYKANNKYGFRSICKKCFKLDIDKRSKKISENYIVKDKKICNVCNLELPATIEYFIKRKDSKDGLSHECKKCSSIRKKKYREEHKEEIANKSKIYRENNKDIIKEYQKKYRKENSEYFKEYGKNYYNENKEEINYKQSLYQNTPEYKLNKAEYDKKYREENKEAISERRKVYCKNTKELKRIYDKKYYKRNKLRIKNYNKEYWKTHKKDKLKNNIYVQRRLARKRNLPNTLTKEQWEQIKIDFNFKCAYCGQEIQLHQEHFIALSKGGEYTHNNIIPACKSCNSSKRDRDFFEWYVEQDFYSNDRKKFILKYLNYTDTGEQQLTISI